MQLLRLFPLVFLCLSSQVFSNPLTVGQPASVIKLEGDEGGRVTGEPWSSDEIVKLGKVVSVFYIDPEEKKLNEAVEEAYEKEKFPFEKHGSIAIINMAAAWYPNSMINNMLQKKQEKFPRTTYVRDIHKKMVKEWGLQDDSVNLTIFDKTGKVLYTKKGQMSPEEISDLMKLIRANL